MPSQLARKYIWQLFITAKHRRVFEGLNIINFCIMLFQCIISYINVFSTKCALEIFFINFAADFWWIPPPIPELFHPTCSDREWRVTDSFIFALAANGVAWIVIYPKPDSVAIYIWQWAYLLSSDPEIVWSLISRIRHYVYDKDLPNGNAQVYMSDGLFDIP